MKLNHKIRLALALTLVLDGCRSREDAVVWREEVRSPQGTVAAIAETLQEGGFGSAAVSTEVYIKADFPKIERTLILALHCNGPIPHAYKLDNVANKGGGIDLKMTWPEPGHLLVTYKGNARVITQMVRFAAMDITLEKAP